MNKIDELNANVTAAIRKVEEAQTELAHAELAIAKATSPDSVEGQIARRGAVGAAREAGLDDWVEELLKTFLAEKGIGKKLKIELKRIASRESRGKWYIAFTWHNDFEPRGGEVEHEEIPLEATTEDAAIAEAHAIASSGKNVKTSCGEMPVPEGYSVIYKTR